MVDASLNTRAPWDSIIDFATHDSFCGVPLFPRQATLLKLIFLETDNMTAYDVEVIESWRKGMLLRRDAFGVQPDIWKRVDYLKERGYRRFPHIQAVLGRRASKGFIGGILGCEQIAFLHSLDNPQKVYGIDEGKDVYLNVGATSQTVAMRQMFADIRTRVERCKYFRPKGKPPWIAESKEGILRVRTAADLRQIATMRAARIPIDHQIASLCAVALSAASTAGRGQTSFGNIYDEFAFHVQTGSVKSDTQIYKDWQPSLGQFGIDALTYVPSSPATKVGMFHTLYQQGKILLSTYKDETGMAEEARQTLVNNGVTMELDAEPTWLIFQCQSWGLYEDWERTPEILGLGYAFPKAPEPDMTDERQIRERRRDPEKFKVEKEGQFAEVQGAYLDADKVDDMFKRPSMHKDADGNPIYWREDLRAQSYGTFDRRYRMHCDPGLSGANFAMAIGHLEDAPPDEHGRVWPHVVFDLLKVWRPMDFPEDPETRKQFIDYVQVHNDLDGVIAHYMSLDKVTFDQWQSASFLAQLKQKYSPGIRLAESNFNEKANQARFEKFKSALNLGWIHCLAGDTGVLTPDGVVPIRELAGKVPQLLTTSNGDGRGGGKWVSAPVFSYGQRPVMKVTLQRNGVEKVIKATDKHRWFVRRKAGTANFRDEVLTEDLKSGQRLSYCYAQRHIGTIPSPIGIAHGFTFGDGTRSRKGSVAQFCGDKDKALIPYFDLHRIVDVAPGVRRALDLPRFFKEKVDLKESPAYLYGWLAGYVAADGHVTKNGSVEIDSNTWANLEHVRSVCNLLGIHTTSIRTKPSYGHGYSDNDSYAINFDRGALTEEFFLIEEHKRRWLDNQDKQHKDYRGYTVVSVEDTGEWEEVFCAEVPGTASFTLEDNILIGNCYPDNFYYDDLSCLLELELKFLSTAPNGKVVKQDVGPVTTKDLADCYSSDTEVLTEHGWKLIKDVGDERVATRSPDGELEYQLPTSRISKHHRGSLIVSDVSGFNFAVTPTHRMLSMDRHSGKQQFVEAQGIAEGRMIDVPRLAFVGDRAPNVISFSGGLGKHRADYGRNVPRVGWSAEADDYLTEHYSHASMPDMCAVLNRGRSAIYNRARLLGLRRGQIGDRYRDGCVHLPDTKAVDFARFLGMWLSDGAKVRGRPGNGVRISQTKSEGIEWIDAMFSRLGWPVRRTRQKNGETVWVVNSRQLKEWLVACQGDGHGLLIPDEVFSRWTRDEMSALLEGLMVGDGVWHSQNGRHQRFTTTSRRLADDVQRLIAHLGEASARIRQQYPAGPARGGRYKANYPLWSVDLDHARAGRLRPTNVRLEPYDGMVYCLTVPNSTLLVRREGMTMWCGNCVMEVTVDLLHDALDQWSREVMGAHSFGSSDVAALRSGREFERQNEAAMRAGGGISAREMLNAQAQDKMRAKLQGRSGSNSKRPSAAPDRTRSIHRRER
jgi:hypothetical protein